jgi:hypothetical protein
MHHHVICPYCENTVLIPSNITNNIFKHGVFIEESSNFSNRVYQLHISLDEDNESITIYDSSLKLEDEDLTDGIKQQLADKFYHLEGCNEYFKVLLDDYGEPCAKKMGDDVREISLRFVVPNGFEAGNIINISYDDNNRILELMLPEQSAEGDLLDITFNLEGEQSSNLNVVRHAEGSIY